MVQFSTTDFELTLAVVTFGMILCVSIVFCYQSKKHKNKRDFQDDKSYVMLERLSSLSYIAMLVRFVGLSIDAKTNEGNMQQLIAAALYTSGAVVLAVAFLLFYTIRLQVSFQDSIYNTSQKLITFLTVGSIIASALLGFGLVTAQVIRTTDNHNIDNLYLISWISSIIAVIIVSINYFIVYYTFLSKLLLIILHQRSNVATFLADYKKLNKTKLTDHKKNNRGINIALSVKRTDSKKNKNIKTKNSNNISKNIDKNNSDHIMTHSQSGTITIPSKDFNNSGFNYIEPYDSPEMVKSKSTTLDNYNLSSIDTQNSSIGSHKTSTKSPLGIDHDSSDHDNEINNSSGTITTLTIFETRDASRRQSAPAPQLTPIDVAQLGLVDGFGDNDDGDDGDDGNDGNDGSQQDVGLPQIPEPTVLSLSHVRSNPIPDHSVEKDVGFEDKKDRKKRKNKKNKKKRGIARSASVGGAPLPSLQPRLSQKEQSAIIKSNLTDKQLQLIENITKQSLLMCIVLFCLIIAVAMMIIIILNGNTQFWGVIYYTWICISSFLFMACLWLSFAFADKFYRFFCQKCHICCQLCCLQITVFKIFHALKNEREYSENN